MRAAAQAQLSVWLERITHRHRDWAVLAHTADEILAFSPPDYLGVTESTRRFFPHWHALAAQDLVISRDRGRFVDAVVSASPMSVVFSGFDRGYCSVLESLRERLPSLPIFVLWHASPMQLTEGCNRDHFETILALGRRGVISRVGCFKTGMGETLVRLGVDAVDVFNPTPADAPQTMRETASDGSGAIRLGLFLAGPSWRKNPYAMLDAAARLGHVEITGVLDRQALRWAESLGLDTEGVSSIPFTRAELQRAASGQHCNLYVSISECSPLFPLESLHWGVPCLVGPTSHLFVRSPIITPDSGAAAAATRLEEWLVVARPEDSDAIAAAASTAIDTTDEILAAYRIWQRAYQPAARISMEKLIGAPLPRTGAS